MYDIDLDKKLDNGVSNNEMAEYLVALESAINLAVKDGQYTLMSVLSGHKLKVEAKLKERLETNLS